MNFSASIFLLYEFSHFYRPFTRHPNKINPDFQFPNINGGGWRGYFLVALIADRRV